MPDDVEERVDFSEQGQARGTPTCFSTYQRELNKLYMIASPAIKHVYSAQQAVEHSQARDYHFLIEDVTRRLWQWRVELPGSMSLDLSQDCPATLSLGEKAHYLQSLSLHLTFDSLLIILHRPFLRRQLSVLQHHGLSGDNGLGVSSLSASAPPNTAGQSRASSEDVLEPANDSSQQQWWNAAVRTSKRRTSCGLYGHQLVQRSHRDGCTFAVRSSNEQGSGSETSHCTHLPATGNTWRAFNIIQTKQQYLAESRKYNDATRVRGHTSTCCAEKCTRQPNLRDTASFCGSAGPLCQRHYVLAIGCSDEHKWPRSAVLGCRSLKSCITA
jgi:hypothetical protein